ncbi:ABC transporter substrate-binding protein [Corticibacter populi]|uniref:ABC transporter substrate-binding protein n=1 Tax=Corticibacter populi TaxID=1550736 RepID=A0A3M6QXH5_9BURK|nr:ABC transporter substrate-binding protein [Corticibacter populi]RMX07708.1 ABC transporter substrate-binding protein [Corticibacter populi]RZS30223.1 peptide/nickel transport system substrate-binding protein [Corticibacter populi]
MSDSHRPDHACEDERVFLDIQRRTLFGLTGALLAGGLLATLAGRAAHAQALPQTSTADGARRGGTLDAVIHPEPPSLAFFINTASPTRAVVSKIFDGLLDYGPDFVPRPQLAENVQVSADGLSWTLQLRKGVFWHDGTPFTSADVQFSAEEIWRQYAPTGRRVFRNLSRVEAPDAHTVILTLSQPAPVIINALDVVAAPVLPKHIYEGTDIPNNPHNNHPVGTGPFVFKEWQRGSHIRLEKFDKYWQEGRPYLDGITWKIIPDVSGRANALETGVVQYGERNPVTFADADRLAKSDKLVVSTDGYNGFSGWYWLLPNLRHPILGKPQVRQAILHAINRDLLVKTVWGGYAVPATGPITSQLKTFYTPDTPQYPFDRKKAEALLDEAGYPKQADGWRFKLTHDFIPYGDDYRRTGEFVRQALRAIGIDVTLRSLDLPTWLTNVFRDYDYELASSWSVNWQDPQLGVEQHYWSKAESKGTPWQNASGYASAGFDQLVEAAQVETDTARRVQLWQQIQHLAQADLPLINLFEFRWFGVWDKRLRNVTDTYIHSQHNFAQVWFDPKA